MNFYLISFALLSALVSGEKCGSVQPGYQFNDAKCPLNIGNKTFALCQLFINPGTSKIRCFRAQADNNINSNQFPVYHNFFIPLCPGYDADIPCRDNFLLLNPAYSALPSPANATNATIVEEPAKEGDLVEYIYPVTCHSTTCLGILNNTQMDQPYIPPTHYVHGKFPGLFEWCNVSSGGWSLDYTLKAIRLDYAQSYYADASGLDPTNPTGDSYHTKLPKYHFKKYGDEVFNTHKKENYFSTIWIRCNRTLPGTEPVYSYEQFVHEYTDPEGVFYYDGHEDNPGGGFFWNNSLVIDPTGGAFLPINVYESPIPDHTELFYSIGYITTSDAIVCDQLESI